MIIYEGERTLTQTCKICVQIDIIIKKKVCNLTVAQVKERPGHPLLSTWFVFAGEIIKFDLWSLNVAQEL